MDKLNQKERNKLKREFPGSISVSNLKKNGYERVHEEILKTIFGLDMKKQEDGGVEA
jgi:GTP-binding protein